MGLTVTDVIGIMESIAPPYLAEEWDNVGLQVGRRNWPVGSIWVALDPTVDVMEAACLAGADLLITHHPLIFNPLSNINFDSPCGRVVELAVLHQTAVFAAHTNLDSAKNGLNDMLANKLGLTQLRAMVPRRSDSDFLERPGPEEGFDCESPVGLGRIGKLPKKITLSRLAADTKKNLSLASIRIVGHHDASIQKVAICTGSGGSLVSDFLTSDADVYVSGDLNFHNGRLVESMGRSMIDIGHFDSEHLMVAELTNRLKQVLHKMGESVSVTACPIEKDPYSII